MTTRIKLLAVGVTALALVGPLAAQPETRRTTTTTTTTTEVRKASVVMNANVVVEDGATVGKITDFVISDGGCIEYVVVDYDNKFVLVPYQVVRVDATKHVVQVSLTREKWRDIPTFTGTNWPVTDQQYITKVRTVFGVSESGFRGDRRDGDRRPLDRGDDRRDNRTDRRDDRRDPPPPQRRDVENPGRPGSTPPPPPPATRPAPPNTDRPRENPVAPAAPVAPPGKPQPPPPPPSSNPPPA
jgi:hypothetical protein